MLLLEELLEPESRILSEGTMLPSLCPLSSRMSSFDLFFFVLFLPGPDKLSGAGPASDASVLDLLQEGWIRDGAGVGSISIDSAAPLSVIVVDKFDPGPANKEIKII